MKNSTIALILFLAILLFLIFAYSYEAFSAPKVKASTDTTLTIPQAIARYQRQMAGLQQNMKYESWYDAYQDYQNNIIYIQSRVDLLKSMKDSTITIPK